MVGLSASERSAQGPFYFSGIGSMLMGSVDVLHSYDRSARAVGNRNAGIAIFSSVFFAYALELRI